MTVSVVYYLTFSNTTGSGGTGSHAKPTMQPDQQHHKSLILQHKNPKKKAWQETETRYNNKPELRHYLKKHIEGGVGGAGQTMADGNQTELLKHYMT